MNSQISAHRANEALTDDSVSSIEQVVVSRDIEEFTQTLNTLKRLRFDFSFHELDRTINSLKHVSRTQKVDREMKMRALKELSRLRLIREIMNFDWYSSEADPKIVVPN